MGPGEPPSHRQGRDLLCQSGEPQGKLPAPGGGDPSAAALQRPKGPGHRDTGVCTTVQMAQKALPHSGERRWAQKESRSGWWGTVRVLAGSGSVGWGQENPLPEQPLKLHLAQQQLVSGTALVAPPRV